MDEYLYVKAYQQVPGCHPASHFVPNVLPDPASHAEGLQFLQDGRYVVPCPMAGRRIRRLAQQRPTQLCQRVVDVSR